jgi:hypothetical protein
VHFDLIVSALGNDNGNDLEPNAEEMTDVKSTVLNTTFFQNWLGFNFFFFLQTDTHK